MCTLYCKSSKSEYLDLSNKSGIKHERKSRTRLASVDLCSRTRWVVTETRSWMQVAKISRIVHLGWS